MKTINKISSVSILLLLSVFIYVSCDDSGDTTPPVISLTAPAEGAILKIGSDIHFDMEISDNDMLKSYSVDIHDNFNNHGHTSLKSDNITTKPFQFNKSWDVSGNKNKHVHHHEIVISEDATPGNYHLMVFCTDAEGNETYIARNIVLSHNGEEGNHLHEN